MNYFQNAAKRLVPMIMGWSKMNRWLVYIIDLFLCLVAFSVAVYIRTKIDPHNTIRNVGWLGILFLVYNAVSFFFFKSYRGLIRHSSFQETWRIFGALLCSCAAFCLTLKISDSGVQYCYFLVQNIFVLLLGLMISVRLVIVYLYYYTMSYSGKHSKNTIVYGIDSHSIALSQWINQSASNNHLVYGFLVREKDSRGLRIHDLPVYNLETDNLDYILGKNAVTTILFPDYSSIRQEKDFISKCLESGLSVMVSPPMEGVNNPEIKQFQMKPIQFEDLLGREEIKIDMESIDAQLHDKVIMITGAAGSIGSELVRQLAAFRPKMLVLFDMAETPLHDLHLELDEKFPDLRYETIIGDVRNLKRLNYVFQRFHPQVVYHAAAYKHVPMMEQNPCEAVLANVLGTQNLTNMSVQNGVERFVMISTDKAVNPTNVMGASKRMAEIYVQSMAKECQQKNIPIQFVTTRFGNVLGSNGSVIPHFKAQIEMGGPVTVTHPDIIRYFMTIPEACRLVLQAASFGKSGEIYVFDMGSPVKIVDLAKRMIVMAGLKPEVDIEIKFTGLRPGEKLYEELLNDKEKTLETGHEKITIANVRQYDFAEVKEKMRQAIDCAFDVDIPATVNAMKQIVPEFKSQNSPFEALDKERMSSLQGMTSVIAEPTC